LFKLASQTRMNMKRNYFRSLLTMVLGTMIISCSKEEAPLITSQTKVAATNALVPYELSFGGSIGNYGAGKDATKPLSFPGEPDDPWQWPSYPFTAISTPTKEYMNETCLVDVSKLENNKTYHTIQNGKLTIGFFSDGGSALRFLKLKSGGKDGWNSEWGTLPGIESRNPDVFYSLISREQLVIYLSKPCIEFGFEVAPNHKNYDHKFGASYGDWLFDDAKGHVSGLVTKSPSGARLISVKATQPFTMITLGSGDSPTGDLPVEGVAIANIRYKLAK
jgi:hypothetical protein